LLTRVPPGLRDSVKPEFHRCCVEVNSGVCRDVAEVGRDLGAKLRGVAGVARRLGLGLAWGGTHPFGHWRDQPISPEPRYQRIAAAYRETLCRQLTFGLHVHVGVPDGDAAARACDRLREDLPALIALAANSPFWCGRPTGLMAHRVEVLGAGPSSGLPPRLGAWDRYAGLVGLLVETGCIASPKDLWWDVRPSPVLGTVEVRACDMPASLGEVLALAALIQCLVCDAAQSEPRGAADEVAAAIIFQQNRWRAARHGLDALLVDPDGGPPVPVRTRLRDMAERLRGVARSLGCSEELSRAAGLTSGPNGAERQLAAYRRSGDLTEVARGLLESGVRDSPGPSSSFRSPAWGLGRPAPGRPEGARNRVTG
jgi:carboxylate-amine ligase